MSLHIRVALGRIVLLNLELLAIDDDVDEEEPPAVLASGQGQIVDPVLTEDETFAYGFRSVRPGS